MRMFFSTVKAASFGTLLAPNARLRGAAEPCAKTALADLVAPPEAEAQRAPRILLRHVRAH